MKMELFFLCLSALALILFPQDSTRGAIEGLRLCGSALIPALLPFLMITRLIVDRLPEPKRAGSLPGLSSTAFIPYGLSFVGGYPSGVAAVASFYRQGKLSKAEARKILPYCNNSGPGFFVGVLGVSLWGDPKKGLLLYGIHVVSALTVFLLCYRAEALPVRIRPLVPREQKSFPQSFQEALGDSCSTMVRICGLVVLFCVLRNLLAKILPHGLLPYMGLLELSSGLLTTRKDSFVLWAIFMGWGGLCVHMQGMSIWQEAGLNIKGYFPKKLLHGLLSGVYAIMAEEQKWYLLGGVFLLCCVFFRFRQNWGRKNQNDRL